MKKPEIKKLSYPLWFTITFYILTVVAPLSFMIVQGFNSESKVFSFSFTVICTLLILWIFARKFLLNNIEVKLQNKKTSLEHDYEIEIGSQDKAKWLWFTNEMWLTILNCVQVALVGGLMLLVAVGIQNAAIKIKGLSFMVAILYLVAYIMKFIVILKLRGSDDPALDEEHNKSEVEDGQSGTRETKL